MIEYIKGELAEVTPTQAVVDCQGVGYGISISLAMLLGRFPQSFRGSANPMHSCISALPVVQAGEFIAT